MAEIDTQVLITAVKSAYELADKLLSSDAEYAESRVKYSAWIAALATAGFGLLLSNYDKLKDHTLLSSHYKFGGAVIVSACVLFLAAVATSALILGVSNRYLASFRSEKTLLCQRSLLITNHLKVFKTDAEVRLVIAGVPTAFIPDKIFADLVATENGGLTEMDYGGPPRGEPPEAKSTSYADQQTAEEFRLLGKMQKAIEKNLRETRGDRFKYERLLRRLFLVQGILVGIGYLALFVVVVGI
jgi:hypothetical protein